MFVEERTSTFINSDSFRNFWYYFSTISAHMKAWTNIYLKEKKHPQNYYYVEIYRSSVIYSAVKEKKHDGLKFIGE